MKTPCTGRRAVAATFLVLAFAFTLASCAPGPNPLRGMPAEGGHKVAGFWQGLWHGVIAPVTFVVSIFRKDVNVYEIRNNGAWYNGGFILGLMVIFGGGGAGGSRRRRD